jgi:hypothetical protein
MSIIRANKWQTVAGLPVNNIVQLVQVDYNTYQTFAGSIGVFSDTGLTAAITPRFATSKILVMCSPQLGHTAGTVVRGRVIRTGPSTVYSTFGTASESTASTTTQYNSYNNSYMSANSTIQFFDSPASTSTCTYTLQIANNTSSYAVYLNGYNAYTTSWGGTSHLTLMEIAQ